MKRESTLSGLFSMIVVMIVVGVLAQPQILNILNGNKHNLSEHIRNVNDYLVVHRKESTLTNGVYAFEDLNLKDFTENNDVRCETYVVQNNYVVETTNCLINDKYYCYNNNGVESCQDNDAPIYASFNDIDFSNMALMESGDLDEVTAQPVENQETIRTVSYYFVNNQKYNIDLTEGYELSVYEYDRNSKYLRTNFLFTDTGVYIPSKNTAYIRMALAYKGDTMSYDKWINALKKGEVKTLIHATKPAKLTKTTVKKDGFFKKLLNRITAIRNAFVGKKETKIDNPPREEKDTQTINKDKDDDDSDSDSEKNTIKKETKETKKDNKTSKDNKTNKDNNTNSTNNNSNTNTNTNNNSNVNNNTNTNNSSSVNNNTNNDNSNTNTTNNNSGNTNNGENSNNSGSTNTSNNEENNGGTSYVGPNPTETSVVLNEEDMYLLDMSLIPLGNGDIDTTTGLDIENKRRMRSANFYEINRPDYKVSINENFGLTVYEYDENNNYLGYKTFEKKGIYTPSKKAKQFRLGLKAPKANEKSYSNGQWYKALYTPTVVARLYIGDIDSLSDRNKNVTIGVPYNVSAETIQNDLFNNSENIANDIWYALVANGVYDPSIDTNRLTFYVSGRGDDRNSGLTKEYPKKTLEQFSGKPNINILVESGYTYDVSRSLKLGDNVTLSSYGYGSRPVLSYYRELNHTFTPVDGYSNLYVTDLTDLPDYNGSGSKTDCNLGQLVIDGEVNWKREVFSSDDNFRPEMLTNKADEKSWSVDFKNGKLYIYTVGNPNNYHIKYAPAVHGIAIDGSNNVTVKGIEITGAGDHGINVTSASNINLIANSFKYIGGSVLSSAGVRYGNAIQIWNGSTNFTATNNIARWIFDTCYTNQGNEQVIENVLFKRNIGMYSVWGIETTGGGIGSSTVTYTENLMYHMTDITEPYTKMQVSGSGHLYGEKTDSTLNSYRNGYKYHQVGNLAMWNFNAGYTPNINNNIFWETNRYLFIGTGSTTPVDITTITNNLFYEDYHLSNNGGAALYKVKASGNKYYGSLSSITSNTTNTVSTHKKSDNYDNTSEKEQMRNLLVSIISNGNYTYNKEPEVEEYVSTDILDNTVLTRVNEIRNTGNTNISNRTGNIYYVSNDGDDNNNGLSEATPFKTISKIISMFNKNLIPAGSTILFRDGDLFRGKQINVKVNNVLIGSYGDITKGKPTLTRSLYDGAKDGVWLEVKPNIWKYQVDGESNVFPTDIGTIWFFCNKGNKNCTNSMNTLDKKFSYAQKITTTVDFDESNIENIIDTLLSNDLEFYHVGHANASDNTKKAGAVYLYSVGNPKNRFDEIEFANGGGIFFKGPNGYVDNIRVLFAGNHGINANTMSNLVVTNSELGFIGGGTQSYNASGNPVRYGNAIEIYGSVKDRDGETVTDGFVLNNNYVYQVYDAGLTFQLSTDGLAHMEKARFTNNVVENCNYSIEYWMYSRSTDQSIIDESYIKDFVVEGNVFRNSGNGISQTRPDKGTSAHLKTWNHDKTYNVVKDRFEVKNNIFGKAYDRHVAIRASEEESLPTIENNTFYGNSNDTFGYYYSNTSVKKDIKYDPTIISSYFPNNTYNVLDNVRVTKYSGNTGNLNWAFDLETGVLSITGTGKMPNYTEKSSPWYDLRKNIKSINIGEGVTGIGKYAFVDTQIETLIIPNNVVEIGEYAFKDNKNLKVALLSENMSLMPANLFNESSTLETIVLGANTTLIKAQAFYGLDKLKTVVMPNENISLESTDILSKYNSIGLDIYTSDAICNVISAYATANNVTNVYCYNMSKYRPIVYGDKVNYTVEFDELHYNSSGTFTIKTLSDSDSVFRNVKYRYKDESGKIHLFDGVKYENGTLKDVRMDVFADASIINKSQATTQAQTVLFFGNSLTAGFGYGMAASDDESDYVYYVMQYVKSFNKDSEAIRYGANAFENATTSEERNTIVEKIISTFESKRNQDKPVRTIILQFGENVTKDEEKATFLTDTTYLINKLKEAYPDAKIYWVSGITHPNTVKRVKESAELNNVTHVDATILRSSDRYKSYIGAIYYQNGKYKRITSGGVGAHPGDYGFTCMGNIIVQALKDNNFSVYSNIVSTNLNTNTSENNESNDDNSIPGEEPQTTEPTNSDNEETEDDNNDSSDDNTTTPVVEEEPTNPVDSNDTTEPVVENPETPVVTESE